MNNLNKAINVIQYWFEINRPDYVTSLQPGLTREEIDKKLVLLPIQFSEEVYTLYEWHNGSDSTDQFIPGYNFPPLESAINNICLVDSEFSKYTTLLEEIDSYYVLPIFSCDFESIATIEIDKKRDCSVVLKSIPEEPPSIYSINLTRIMQVIADCYESGVYGIKKNNKGENELVENYGALEILRNHNHELVEFILDKIHQAKEGMSSEIMNNLYYLIEWFGDSRAVELLLELLEIPFEGQHDPENLSIIKDVAAYGLGKLKVAKAVEPLIDALSSNYRNIRYRAAEMLSELDDPRAIPALLVTLSDFDNGVRNNCKIALVKLGAVDALLANASEHKNRYIIESLWLLFSPMNRKGLTLEQKDRIVSVLTSLTNDPSSEVQRIASDSLARARKELLEKEYQR